MLHLAFSLPSVPGLLLNVGDPVRNNTLAVEITLSNSLDEVSLFWGGGGARQGYLVMIVHVAGSGER